MNWKFYGRSQDLDELAAILARRRWFFARITGRRRIGKTALVRHALEQVEGEFPVFYVQVPDSGPAGVLSAVHDAMEIFGLPQDRFPRPDSLLALARLVEQLARDGYVVALDEFQYFSRKILSEFTSHLQASVDRLSRDAGNVPGGLIVLGSIHTELVALLDDRDAPLFNRTTDQLELKHLDIASVQEILQAHGKCTPERLLFLWNLFEGVPKFYRDAFEHGVLGLDRRSILARMFFLSSSPLRSEAENWFLSELRGRYDVILKYVARNPGCSNGAIVAHVRETSPGTAEQVGGYLKILIDRYQMLERRQPIFSRSNARSGRYYIQDNFLRSWLAALHGSVAALHFRPEHLLLDQADQKLVVSEGHGLERLVAQLYRERSKRGLAGFSLTRQLEGYWDSKDTEIDLVALNEEDRIIRLGSCKRNPQKLVEGETAFHAHIDRFLDRYPKYKAWQIERFSIAPEIPQDVRKRLARGGTTPQDLADLTQGL